MPCVNSRPGRVWARPGGRIPLLALLVALASCSRTGEKNGRSRPPTPVVVERAAVRDVPKLLSAIGTVQSPSTVAITSRVSGQIAEVHFSEGQDVERGDLLFQIDPRPFELALRQAEATLRRDRAELANARVQARRYANLLKHDLVSREEADARQVAVRMLEATVKADEATAANARVFLGFTQIRAPISGRTGNLLVTAGNLVRADENRPLVTVVQVSPIYVTFALPQRFLAEVRAEQQRHGPLEVEVRVPQGEPRFGALTFIDNAVDTSTGTIALKATLPNTDQALWPGQLADVSVVLRTLPDAVLVPARSVQRGQQGDYVFVVAQSNQAEMRTVSVGDQLGQQVVVMRGIRGGERVVTDGLLGLVPGAPVQVRAAREEPGPAVGGSGADPDAGREASPDAGPQGPGPGR